jgi:hypothetical protein
MVRKVCSCSLSRANLLFNILIGKLRNCGMPLFDFCCCECHDKSVLSAKPAAGGHNAGEGDFALGGAVASESKGLSEVEGRLS